MDRREFIKSIAAIAAAAMVDPHPVEALTAYYEANSPTTFPLLALDDIWLFGNATCSQRISFDLTPSDGDPMRFQMNAFGGSVVWRAAPGMISYIGPDLRRCRIKLSPKEGWCAFTS